MVETECVVMVPVCQNEWAFVDVVVLGGGAVDDERTGDAVRVLEAEVTGAYVRMWYGRDFEGGHVTVFDIPVIPTRAILGCTPSVCLTLPWLFVHEVELE